VARSVPPVGHGLTFLFENYKHYFKYEKEQTMKMISSEDVQMR